MVFKVIIDDEKLEPGYKPGWGISVYFPDLTLLFDTGEDNLPLEQNLSIAGIEKEDIKYIFITRDNWEHTGGLEAVMGVNKVVYVPSRASSDLIEMIHSVGAECRETERIKEILPSVYAVRSPVEEVPEQALLIQGGLGVSIMIGSSKSGALNIMKATQALLQPIDLLFGKLNALSLNEGELLTLAREIDRYKPRRVAPAHCSGRIALKIFKGYFKDRFIDVGIGLEGEV